MIKVRVFGSFALSVVTTYILAAFFYTQQVLAKLTAIGAQFTPAQQLQTYIGNWLGLAPAYGLVLTVALLLGFLIAAQIKKSLTSLAPIAYPAAGAAGVYAAIWLIENIAAPGAIGGARGAMGLALQCFAGGLGGLVFSVLRR